MPRFFLFGSIRGLLMDTMRSIVDKVYPEAIEFHFRESEQVHENIFPEHTDTGEIEEVRMHLTDFSRPSDYHLKAVVAKQLGHSASGGGDGHLEPSLTRNDDDSNAEQSIPEEELVKAAQLRMENELKIKIAEQWANLLSTTEKEAEEGRRRMMNRPMEKKPIRKTLDYHIQQLSDSIHW